jgi:MoaA/NifB/PqqE/SkfB family radical SAM enzyme
MITFEELDSIHVELSSACNAACPNCPRNVYGGYTVPSLNPTTMSLEDFKIIFSESVLLKLKRILMCGNHGDPIYCSSLPDILSYIGSVNNAIDIKIHTNGGIRNTAWWSALANAYTPDKLTVIFSIDGLEDTNHIYRRRVVWDRVVSNATAFNAAGGTSVWEFLIFDHNKSQTDEAKEMSAKLGFKEILFKRPFGFETINSGTEAMNVIDADGNHEYLIKPATDFKHSVNMSDSVKKEVGFDVPKVTYTDTRPEVDVQSVKGSMVAHDDIPISCMTKSIKEIYVDSNGVVHPCCFLGVNYGIETDSIDHIQYTEWLNRTVNTDKINAKLNSIQSILQSSYLAVIERNWNSTHHQDRLMCCTRMCGVKGGLKKGLYV